ncbi:MAG: hypothetical protein ACQJCO_02285 [cyanobacterium endosymbiont of Rhopalodia sterrenbergii]
MLFQQINTAVGSLPLSQFIVSALTIPSNKQPKDDHLMFGFWFLEGKY